MIICVAGWYYNQEFLQILDKVKHHYPVYFVCHRSPVTKRFSGSLIPNEGLEFGCFDWFLKNKWGSSPELPQDDVLFCHDDAVIPKIAIEHIASLSRKADQVYIFRTKQEAAFNGYAHGRAMWCSEKCLSKLKESGGIPFDTNNKGYTNSLDDSHNNGIRWFRERMQSLRPALATNQYIIMPSVRLGCRGAMEVYDG